jgi:Mg2+ and Co2+ transporter CorA
MQDADTWKWLLEHIWVPFVAVIGWIWKMSVGRLDRIEAALEMKADKSDVQKALGHIERLYSRAEEDRKTVRDLHDSAIAQMNKNHAEVLNALRK